MRLRGGPKVSVAGAKLIKASAQDMCMYCTRSYCELKAYGDPWHRGRYCAEMCAELPADADNLDAVLRSLGYEVVDSDQWGRSYRHRRSPNRIAELDELPQEDGHVRLVLREADLDASELPAAEGEMELAYARLCPPRHDCDGPSPRRSDSDAEEYFCFGGPTGAGGIAARKHPAETLT